MIVYWHQRCVLKCWKWDFTRSLTSTKSTHNSHTSALLFVCICTPPPHPLFFLAGFDYIAPDSRSWYKQPIAVCFPVVWPSGLSIPGISAFGLLLGWLMRCGGGWSVAWRHKNLELIKKRTHDSYYLFNNPFHQIKLPAQLCTFQTENKDITYVCLPSSVFFPSRFWSLDS